MPRSEIIGFRVEPSSKDSMALELGAKATVRFRHGLRFQNEDPECFPMFLSLDMCRDPDNRSNFNHYSCREGTLTTNATRNHKFLQKAEC